MINYLDLTKWSNGKICGVHLPVAFWAIEPQEVVQKNEKPVIIGTKAAVVKKYVVSLIPVAGLACAVAFDTLEEAQKWLTDYVINA